MSHTTTEETPLSEIIDALQAGDAEASALDIALRGFHKGTMQYSVFMPYPFTAVMIPSGRDEGHYQYGDQVGPIRDLAEGKQFSPIPDKPFIMKALGSNPRARILVEKDQWPVIVYNGSVTYTGPNGQGAFLLNAPSSTRRVVRYTPLNPSKHEKVEIKVDGGPTQRLAPNTDVMTHGKELIVSMAVTDGGVVVTWKP